MEPKQNPFSVYDFLGYFVPGALFLYSLGYLGRHSGYISEIKAKFAQVLGPDPSQVSFYLPFVLFSYLLGHLLSLLSAFTIERFANWCHGYPSKYLLRLNESHGYFDEAKDNRLRWAYRVVVPIFLFPVAFFEFVVGWFFSGRDLYVKQFEKSLRPVIQNRVSDILCDKCDWEDALFLELTLARQQKRAAEIFDPRKEDFFNVVAQFIVSERPEHLRTALNYVALYGFLRTTCLLAVIWFWVPVFQLVAVDCLFKGSLNLCDAMARLPVAYLISVGAISFLLFVGFVKFYRRYSRTVLLGLLTIPCVRHMPIDGGLSKAKERLEKEPE